MLKKLWYHDIWQKINNCESWQMLRCCSSLVDMIVPTTSLLQRSVYKTIKWKSFFGQIYLLSYTLWHQFVLNSKSKIFWGKHNFLYYVPGGSHFNSIVCFDKFQKQKHHYHKISFIFLLFPPPRSQRPPAAAVSLSPGERSRPANFLRRELDWRPQWLKICYLLVVVGMVMII